MDRKVEELVALARQRASAADFGPESEALNRKILDTLPTDVGSMTRLAKCLEMRDEPFEAQVLYATVLQVDPENRIALNHLVREHVATATPPRRRRGSAANASGGAFTHDEAFPLVAGIIDRLFRAAPAGVLWSAIRHPP